MRFFPAHAAVVALLAAASARPLAAQRLTLEGILDAETWKTDAGSRLLARNGGRLAGQARLFAFGSWRPVDRVELLGVAYVEGGSAEDKNAEATIDLFEAKVTASRAAVVEAGRILMPLGTFGARRYPTTNPVVGSPDLYPPLYPWGAKLGGAIGAFDYRLAIISLPQTNENYLRFGSAPLNPANRPRPVFGVGLQLGPSIHIGAAGTAGPYLGPTVDRALPAGTTWWQFNQGISSADVHLSAGYVDLHGEVAWSSYDVPTVAKSVEGFGWYAEPRVTLSPRVFVAARVEHYRYAFIAAFPTGPATYQWIGTPTTENNAELALGYRFTADALLKASVRRDNWPNRSPSFPTPDGYAVAAQFSWHFSAAGLFAPTY